MRWVIKGFLACALLLVSSFANAQTCTQANPYPFQNQCLSASDLNNAFATAYNYSGASFVPLNPANNLNDVANASVALANLGGISGLASQANNTAVANISGSSAVPVPNTITAILDSAFTNTQGAMLYRSSSAWVGLSPGTNGQFLTSGGAAADLSWTSASGSGTVNSCGTAASFAWYSGTGTTVGCDTNLKDNGSFLVMGRSVDLGANETVVEYSNAASTGTTLNKLAVLTGAPSTVVLPATNVTSGIIGVVVGGAGTSGTAQIAVLGTPSCVFDGATTAGHAVVNSPTTAGDCHDTGAATPPAGNQLLGYVLSTNASGGTYTFQMTGAYAPATPIVSVSGTAPVGAATASGAVTVSLNLDSNFTTSSNNLAFASIASGNILANSGSGSAEPTSTTLTATFDKGFASTQGDILYRGASTWAALAPGTSGTPLLSGGAAANPAWGTDANLVYTDAQQTYSAAQRSAVQTVANSSNTYTPNFNTGQNFNLTLVTACTGAGTCTLANPSTTPVAGQSGMIAVTQSASGSDLLSWGTLYKFAGATKPTLTTTASATDFLPYYVFSATQIIVGAPILNAH